MPSSLAESDLDVRAVSVSVTDDSITVELEDGRSVSVPTGWYPRLKHATAAERKKYEIDGYGVSWPDIEADFSIRGLLLGHKSAESGESLKFWLDNRKKGRNVLFGDYMKHRRPGNRKKTA